MNASFNIILLEFDWKSLLFGENDSAFLYVVFIRTAIMFLIILIGLRMLGKRSVNQLSVFELGVIIGLGSAAGDPMFYESVGILTCILVFAVVVALYHLFRFLVNNNQKLRFVLEGKPVVVIKDGEMCIDQIKKETSVQDVFLLLRLKSVSQLGQVHRAILEEDGQMSVFFFDDEEVKYGLPIIPEYCEHPLNSIPVEGYYSCIDCSHTKVLQTGSLPVCNICSECKWVKAIKDKRIT